MDTSTNEIVIYTENESFSGATILLTIEVVTTEEVASSEKLYMTISLLKAAKDEDFEEEQLLGDTT